jgi:hypothetical protein
MRYSTQFGVCLFLTAMLSGTVSAPASQDTPQPTREQPASAHIANPASQNCIRQGGKLVIRKRGDGGEYGVCLFANNQQCEEWAMLRGDCPVGGIRITGHETPAAQYCVITGGAYAITGNNNRDNKQGTCTFKNGKKCEVWDYFKGECGPND